MGAEREGARDLRAKRVPEEPKKEAVGGEGVGCRPAIERTRAEGGGHGAFQLSRRARERRLAAGLVGWVCLH